MSGNWNQRVQGNPETYTVPATGVAVGAIVADETGATPRVGIVYPTGPTTKAVAVFAAGLVQFAPTPCVWTPGAGGSGNGTLDIAVVDQAGAPVSGVVVNVGFIAGGTIGDITASTGTLTGRAISGAGANSGAVVQGLVSVGGHLILAVDGATGTDLNMTLSLVSAASGFRVDNETASLSTTTP